MDNNLKNVNDSITSTLNSVKESVNNGINKTAGMFNENMKFAMSILVPILIVLLYLLYKNTFSKKNLDKLADLKNQEKIELVDLPKCQEIPEELRHRLIDYYIASSFMTPCMNDLHYDYVSDDFIKYALQSGARYIEIPICQSEINDESPPTIGLAEKGKLMITSLNTLDVITSFNNILTTAFIHKGKKINYPLFINLRLYTGSPFTLNLLAKQLKSIFGDMILDPEKYKKFPINFEKICNLLNKVIFFCDDKYQDSLLKDIIVPTNTLFQKLYYGDIGKFNVSENRFYTNDYHKLLSETEQEKEYTLFQTLYPNLESIIADNKEINDASEESDESENWKKESENRDVGEEIMSNDDFRNRLLLYNKVGLTVVYPNEEGDVTSKNFDFEEAFYNGCQFVCMNYQKNDEYIDKYTDIFKYTSYRLKPASLRYTELEIEEPDLQLAYEKTSNELIIKNIDHSFYYRYLNTLIAIESLTSPGSYLTLDGLNLIFNPTNKFTKSNCFIIKDTEIDTDNKSLFIESISNNNYVIGLDSTSKQDLFKLVKISNKFNEIENQSFYPVKNLSVDKDPEYNSLKLASSTKNLYLGFYNKHLKGYIESKSPEVLNSLAFKLTFVKHYQYISFITLSNYGLFGYSSGLVGLNKNNKMSKYVLISVNNNKNILGTDLFLQNMENNKYLELGNGKLLFEKSKRSNQLNSNNVFTINKKSGFYTLVSNNNKVLNYVDEDIKFLSHEDSKTNTTLFKIKLDYKLV